MEGTMIPKSQIERAVGPILSMFLDVVLSETFREDKKLSGSLKLVCPEFPLKKKDNWQSTNIDWLMYNKDRKQLLFVELKTSDTSINDDQNSIYHIKQEAILHNGGAFLIEDLEQMRDRSSEFGKYQHILETKVLPLKDEISNCHDAKIIWFQKSQNTKSKVTQTVFLHSECYRNQSRVSLLKNGESSETTYVRLMTHHSDHEIANIKSRLKRKPI